MRIYFSILLSAAIGSAIFLFGLIIPYHAALLIVGNLAFVAGIAAMASRAEADLVGSPLALVLSPVAYVVTVVLLVFAGALIDPISRPAATVLMGFLGLGYSPAAGPDTPFFDRLPVWVLSNLFLAATGLATAILLQRARSFGKIR
ncbi:MAG TPA: hypothetical protein VF727_12010 [Allosphingosinicella sp.]|jgi:hypothetical protein